MLDSLSEAFYYRELEPVLKIFQRQKKGVLSAAIIVRLYYILFFTAVLSLIFGFLGIFPFRELIKIVAIMWFFKGFFYLLMTIVVLTLVNAFLIKPLKQKISRLETNKVLSNLLNIIVTAFIEAGAFIIGTYYLGDHLDYRLIVRVAIIIVPMVLLFFPVHLLAKKEAKFVTEFKKELLPMLLSNIGTSVTYMTEECVSKSNFISAGLFDIEKIFKYRGEDLLTGKNKNTDFEMSYINVKTMATHGSGKSETKYEEVFKGVLYVSDFNKNFSGKTLIYPDFMRNVFGGVIGEMVNKVAMLGEKKLVKLENIEFEREFAVYSTDQVEARYILSPLLMERMLELKKQFKTNMLFSFNESKMIIALPNPGNIFNPNIFENLVSYRVANYYHLLFSNFIGITDELSLNTRLWGKK